MIVNRVLTGLLLAPLWVPITAGIYAALIWSPPDFLGDAGGGSWIGMVALIGALLGYLAVLAVGLPTHKILRRRDYHSVWAYLTMWFAVAVMVWLVVFTASFAQYGLVFSFSYLAETIVHRPYVPISFGIMWAVVGATFWPIVRPDREPLSPKS